MSETPVSRRAVLTTGTLTALGIGLMSAAGARPEPVAAACRATWAEFEERRDVSLALGRQLDAVSTPEQRAALLAWEAANNDEADWQAAELARHLPGLAPVIPMLWLHIQHASYGRPGACCTVAEGHEP